MDLSIIVPVFNTEEQKLERCFKSINQINDILYECLIIDDGSKNEIAEICKKVSVSNNKFKYYCKENGGVSSARNKGIELAIGKKIIFVDSDDEIMPQSINELIHNNSDIIFTDISMIDEKGNIHTWDAFDRNDGKIEVDEVINRMVVTGIINGPVGKIFDRDFIIKNQIKFDEKMVNGEDAYFLMKMLENNPNMYYFGRNTYKYFKENVTSTNRMINYSNIYIENNAMMYVEMLSVIALQKGKILNYSKMEYLASERYINQLFNTAADFSHLHKLNYPIKSLIVDKCLLVDKNHLIQCNLITRIRFYIINKQKWRLLYVIAKIRNLYLALKRIVRL